MAPDYTVRRGTLQDLAKSFGGTLAAAMLRGQGWYKGKTETVLVFKDMLYLPSTDQTDECWVACSYNSPNACARIAELCKLPTYEVR